MMRTATSRTGTCMENHYTESQRLITPQEASTSGLNRANTEPNPTKKVRKVSIEAKKNRKSINILKNSMRQLTQKSLNIEGDKPEKPPPTTSSGEAGEVVSDSENTKIQLSQKIDKLEKQINNQDKMLKKILSLLETKANII